MKYAAGILAACSLITAAVESTPKSSLSWKASSPLITKRMEAYPLHPLQTSDSDLQSAIDIGAAKHQREFYFKYDSMDDEDVEVDVIIKGTHSSSGPGSDYSSFCGADTTKDINRDLGLRRVAKSPQIAKLYLESDAEVEAKAVLGHSFPLINSHKNVKDIPVTDRPSPTNRIVTTSLDFPTQTTSYSEKKSSLGHPSRYLEAHPVVRTIDQNHNHQYVPYDYDYGYYVGFDTMKSSNARASASRFNETVSKPNIKGPIQISDAVSARKSANSPTTAMSLETPTWNFIESNTVDFSPASRHKEIIPCPLKLLNNEDFQQRRDRTLVRTNALTNQGFPPNHFSKSENANIDTGRSFSTDDSLESGTSVLHKRGVRSWMQGNGYYQYPYPAQYPAAPGAAAPGGATLSYPAPPSPGAPYQVPPIPAVPYPQTPLSAPIYRESPAPLPPYQAPPPAGYPPPSLARTFLSNLLATNPDTGNTKLDDSSGSSSDSSQSSSGAPLNSQPPQGYYAPNYGGIQYQNTYYPPPPPGAGLCSMCSILGRPFRCLGSSISRIWSLSQTAADAIGQSSLTNNYAPTNNFNTWGYPPPPPPVYYGQPGSYYQVVPQYEPYVPCPYAPYIGSGSAPSSTDQHDPAQSTPTTALDSHDSSGDTDSSTPSSQPSADSAANFGESDSPSESVTITVTTSSPAPTATADAGTQNDQPDINSGNSQPNVNIDSTMNLGDLKNAIPVEKLLYDHTVANGQTMAQSGTSSEFQEPSYSPYQQQSQHLPPPYQPPPYQPPSYQPLPYSSYPNSGPGPQEIDYPPPQGSRPNMPPAEALKPGNPVPPNPHFMNNRPESQQHPATWTYGTYPYAADYWPPVSPYANNQPMSPPSSVHANGGFHPTTSPFGNPCMYCQAASPPPPPQRCGYYDSSTSSPSPMNFQPQELAVLSNNDQPKVDTSKNPQFWPSEYNHAPQLWYPESATGVSAIVATPAASLDSVQYPVSNPAQRGVFPDIKDTPHDPGSMLQPPHASETGYQYPTMIPTYGLPNPSPAQLENMAIDPSLVNNQHRAYTQPALQMAIHSTENPNLARSDNETPAYSINADFASDYAIGVPPIPPPAPASAQYIPGYSPPDQSQQNGQPGPILWPSPEMYLPPSPGLWPLPPPEVGSTCPYPQPAMPQPYFSAAETTNRGVSTPPYAMANPLPVYSPPPAAIFSADKPNAANTLSHSRKARLNIFRGPQ